MCKHILHAAKFKLQRVYPSYITALQFRSAFTLSTAQHHAYSKSIKGKHGVITRTNNSIAYGTLFANLQCIHVFNFFKVPEFYPSYHPILTSRQILECHGICRVTHEEMVECWQSRSQSPASRHTPRATRNPSANCFRAKYQQHWKKKNQFNNFNSIVIQRYRFRLHLYSKSILKVRWYTKIQRERKIYIIGVFSCNVNQSEPLSRTRAISCGTRRVTTREDRI